MSQVAADAGQASAPAHVPPVPAHFDSAYDSVRADQSVQFDFPQQLPKPPETSQWLIDLFKTIARLYEAGKPVWPWLFWGFVALGVLALIVALVPSLRRSALALWRRVRRKAEAEDEPEAWRPEEHHARALLEEADALAAAGQYDEAVHLVLFRSIEDIEAWRGGLVRPSLTSRDIARADALPDSARPVFSRIVAAVERSLFGGRALGRDDWIAARADYAKFALGTTR